MTEPTEPPPPPRAIRTVGIIAKARLPEAAEVVSGIVDWLSERGINAEVETETARLAGRDGARTFATDALPAQVDLLVVLGGDGTLLGVARSIADAGAGTDIPVLAVNFGSLGFLTEVTLPELYRALESVLDGTAGIDERQMLRSTVIRDGHIMTDRVVLNDIVIGKAALSNIIELTINVGEQFVTSLRADGLIVASPTGSTAYSMAAGGPIVHPLVDALLLTPIAPHTLTNRPIVIPSTTAVRVTPALEGPHCSAYASFDGQSGLELVHGDVVTVEKAVRPLKIIRAESRGYFAVLRQKLKWGER
jgi:NAD+ kinase